MKSADSFSISRGHECATDSTSEMGGIDILAQVGPGKSCQKVLHNYIIFDGDNEGQDSETPLTPLPKFSAVV